jgi:hypothetical protein
VPEIDVDIRHRLARVGVDELDVQVQGDTLLVLNEVVADELAAHVYPPVSIANQSV